MGHPAGTAHQFIGSSGIIRSDPKAKSIPRKPWWIIAECDPEIGRYLRHWFNLYHRGGTQLVRPAWDSHISIVCGEEPPHKLPWGRWDGQEADFEYDPALNFNGEYAWLSVVAPLASRIREELGLPPPSLPFHLTVGRTI